MKDKEFIAIARVHDFTPRMAAFLAKFVSRKPHTHTVDQIEDFDEAVSDIVEDLEEDSQN